MLSKVQFLKRIEFIKRFHNRMVEFDKALEKYAPSDFSGFWDDETYNFLIECLEQDMQDEYHNITWWICDCEFGANKNLCKIWEGEIDHDPDWIIETPEQLYDYLFIQNTKTPSKDALRSTVKAQDNGFKFALKHINDLKEANSETGNIGWKDRDSLFDFILKTITNDYLYARGTGADLNYHDSLYIISILDKES